jgi:hypothetical protein
MCGKGRFPQARGLHVPGEWGAGRVARDAFLKPGGRMYPVSGEQDMWRGQASPTASPLPVPRCPTTPHPMQPETLPLSAPLNATTTPTAAPGPRARGCLQRRGAAR